MKTTKPEAAEIDSASETTTAPRRTMRARLEAYLWTNRAYVAAWTDGAICGVILFVVANVLMGGK
ncbi:MAG: hypothetical protein U1E02_19670 [Hydrogenophaga sp.]|nr:hypothetical protein [Hydrogenophaga sp.]MDP1782669.1 hypothetical protein [Hydrogenophaga sp.]MDZ4126374.1 hypothetical protein [Hydrogenophaga sp.]